VNKQYLLIAILASTASPALAQGAAPARTPQPVPKAAFIQRIDASFSAVDTNKDGFSDKAEIEAAEAKVLAARKAQLINEREAAFRELDGNKDGSLTLKEFNARLVAQPLPKANAAPMISKLDTNKDGKISAAENRAPAAAQFDRADTNKDGTLSVDEQKARARKYAG
jgi:Ca2+-binding EF-hand superfamily protein